MVENGAFSHEIDYVTILLEIINLKGHLNFIFGSKVTAILLNGWILATGGASLGRVCVCSLRSRLVFIKTTSFSLDFFFHQCSPACHHLLSWSFHNLTGFGWVIWVCQNVQFLGDLLKTDLSSVSITVLFLICLV